METRGLYESFRSCYGHKPTRKPTRLGIRFSKNLKSGLQPGSAFRMARLGPLDGFQIHPGRWGDVGIEHPLHEPKRALILSWVLRGDAVFRNEESVIAQVRVAGG